MNAFMGFIMGPMVWISALVFLAGVLYRLISILKTVHEREKFILSHLSLKYSLRSIIAWLIPFFPEAARKQPIFYGVSYGFHLLLFGVPLFLAAHLVLVEEAFGISWPVLSNGMADILTLLVIFALVFFGVRRAVVPEVRFLTTAKEYILLFMVLLPFLTGFLAYHQFFLYPWVMVVHVVSGEIMLMVIPFSRFSHMITAPLIRAYTGSEFGSVRHAKDW